MMPRTEENNQTPQWHALAVKELLSELHTSREGLSEEEARHRLESEGPNALEAESGSTLWSLVLKQIRSPLIYILLAAALLSILVHHYTDAGVILFVVVFNTVLGVIQEWRAEQALAALSKLTAPKARVLRDGQSQRVDARKVVPGDVIVLETGVRVPADARLIDTEDLQVDESALTGESEPASKTLDPVDAQVALAERSNMVFMSTAVTQGNAKAVVTATGMQSEMGTIAGQVRETQREETPLQKRLAQLVKVLGISGIGLGLLLFGIGIWQGHQLIDMALFSIALAVSAIPEGLPAVISVTLALGVRRMTRRGSVVRRLPAVETLGSTTVICSDKTGTITRNEMTVTQAWSMEGTLDITGTGYSPEGEIRMDNQHPETLPQSVSLLMRCGVLANNASHYKNEDKWTIEGDPTEAALLVMARKAGMDPDSVRTDHPRIDQIPFNSNTKYMVSMNYDTSGDATIWLKGAPERVLDFSSHVLDSNGQKIPLDDETRKRIREQTRNLAHKALRPLAAAFKAVDDGIEELKPDHVESDLIFIGLWGMMDPPREEAIQAIHQAQEAGIRIIMITGDQPDTAAAIARDVGIEQESTKALTGQELDAFDEDELREALKTVSVFARVSPSHKMRIVDALQSQGEIVAMTGDGVNDAPALKSVDIGIAMGRSGTEVAREAAEMVLTEDHFGTIVHAIEEGRVIYSNLKRVAFFLLTTSLAEVLALGGALLLGLPLPLTAVMILWINLISDAPADVPLGIEPRHWDVLKQPPRSPQENLLSGPMLRRLFILGPIVALGTLGLYIHHLPQNWQSDTVYQTAQTVAFTTLAAFQWFQAILSRSPVLSVFSIGFFRNRWLIAGISTAIILQLLVVYTPFGHTLFNTVSLSLSHWLLIIPVAASVWIVDEILKGFHAYGKPPHAAKHT
jgi:Ca2+-transporting ATPase